MSKTLSQILIVEDEGIVAKDIQGRLKKLGYDSPVIVFSGEEAVKKAAELNPDLILMDIRLTGTVDGIQAADEIRKRFNVPVVYVTAYADDHTLERAKMTEPYGYILKPVQDKELGIVVEMALYKHRMEAKLKEHESWLSTLLQSITDGVIATNREGEILFMNHEAEKMTGWKEEEAKGENLLLIFQVMDQAPPDLSELKKTEIIEQNVVLRTKESSQIPIRETISTIHDSEGQVFGFVVVFQDITFRKRSEEVLIHLAHDLARSNAELRQFAYASAYELKEPLKFISGYAQLISERYRGKLGKDAESYLSTIVEKSVHLQILIEELLARARSTSQIRARVNLNTEEAFNTACFNLKGLIEKTHAVVEADFLPLILADEVQIIQLFQNLIENAIQFRANAQPKIQVSAKRKGNEWMFSIADNGIGIDREKISSIFLPFHKIDLSTSGYGIGLTVCKNIVESYGGKIWVESESGKGSIFYFSLPAD
jgi:PAS domain S-box-containing protein